MQDTHLFDNKHILIVDDNLTNIKLLKTMLNDYGYKNISGALSAKEAYVILEESKIDLILLDVMMPEIDGIEACRTIRRMHAHKKTPIIMVTADNRDETLQSSFDAGADDFSIKPVNIVNLNSRIQSAFMNVEKDLLILKQTRDSAINDIIDTLAHQWRQPLAAISATAINIGISHELDDLDSDKLTKHLKEITNYTQELSKTIDDIREISNTKLAISKTDINKLVVHAAKIIDISFKNNDISLNIEKAELKDINIYPGELLKVILNILINAQEAFLRNKKTSNKHIDVTTSQDEEYTRINIKDNAGGINDIQLSKIFDPYFSTKNEKNGKGLGLHSCKQIIELHQGGKINITSKNEFTEISIELLN